MAFGSAAGYDNLPNGKWNPSIYSQKVLKFFRRASVAEAITNTDYSGEIENFGDTVKIIKEPTVTVSSYTRGSVVNTQDLSDTEISLIVDQGNYFAFKVDDIEERQSHVNWESLATSSGAFSLKKAFDYNVLKEINDSAVQGTATTDTGAAGAAISCDTGNEAANVIARFAQQLDANDVPQENRWFVANSGFYEILKQADAKLMDASVTGESASALMNGAITARKIHGFTLYQTNVIQTGSVGSAAAFTFGPSATSGETTLLAGHMSAVATASHIAKTEVIRDPDSFADIVRGLHVFGRKVLRGSGTGFKGVLQGVVDLNT
jgi:hypothetical protein|tara:strand:+ start:1325 stop:2287 length:963 start_codon:yes stop_codon:yes gene_type:complete